MLDLRLPVSGLSCPLGHTCEKCLLYVSMPVNVPDPTTGKTIESSQFECAFVWNMLGAWDAGRQSQGVHAAVAQQTNETIKRQDAFLNLVTDAGQRRLASADSQD